MTNEFTGYRWIPHTKECVYQDTLVSFELLGIHLSYNYEWADDSCYLNFKIGKLFVQFIKPEKTNILNILVIIRKYKYFKLWLANPLANSDFN